MVLHFNVTGEKRKAMVKAIEKGLGIKAEYLGAPSFAYEAGGYRVGKDGTLTWADIDDANPVHMEQSEKVIDACVAATGMTPDEWEDNAVGKGEAEPEQKVDKSLGLTVTIPEDRVDVKNLTSLLEAKGELIKKALGVRELKVTTDKDGISFPWFGEVQPEEALTYTKFITALCDMSKNQKRITAKPRKNENEKYAFRCFLLRLGFIGDEYKDDRKILLSKLDGSSAFKNGMKGGEQ